MPKQVRYYGTDEDVLLGIYRNADGNLYVSIEDVLNMTQVYVELPPNEAQEIITDLARGFDMLHEEGMEGKALFFPHH